MVGRGETENEMVGNGEMRLGWDELGMGWSGWERRGMR